jgi:hypothetical protein
MRRKYQYVHLYRTAIALSNMGVTLLERKCYLEAVETLRDALLLIRAVVNPVNEDGTTVIAANTVATIPVPTDTDIQFMIQRATNYLMYGHPFRQPHTCTSPPVVDKVPSIKSKKFRLKVLSDCRSSTLDILQAANDFDASLVRIEDTMNQDEDCCSDYVVQTTASTILLNYGTACRCLQLVSGNWVGDATSRNIYFLCEALDFLRVSYKILIRLVEPVLSSRSRDQLRLNEIEVSRTLNLSVLLLQTLVNICYQLDLRDEISMYLRDYKCVCHTITRLQHPQFWHYNVTAAMA